MTRKVKKAPKIGKYKKGICPVCGLPLVYSAGEPSDSMYVYYNVVCGGTIDEDHGCGWTGREWYSLKFIELIGG